MLVTIQFPTKRQAQNAVNKFIDLYGSKYRNVLDARVCYHFIHLQPLLVWPDGKAVTLGRSYRATGPAWQARRFDMSDICSEGQNFTLLDANFGKMSEYVV